MTRKCVISFVSLLALAAFVAAPAAQAAEGHYYENAVKLAGSKGKLGEANVNVSVGWGTLQLLGIKGAASGTEVSCHNVAAGTDYNPESGLAGKGATEVFETWHCEQKGICAGGEALVVKGFKFPWLSEITGSEEWTGANKETAWRSTTKGIQVKVTCNGTVKQVFEGQNEPLAPSGLLKGTSAKAPGTTSFDTGSGELNLVEGEGGPTIGSSKTNGKVVAMGYAHEELIQVKE